MYDNFGALDASIQEKIDTDNDFQATLVDLSDEDRETAVKTRKSELLDGEIKTLADRAKEAEKNKELADNQKKRAEKAEQEAKKNKSVEETKSDISSKDTIAFINAKVHEDDMDEVIEYANFKKISVSEALKSSVIKASLEEKAELRKSAEATNTAPVRRGAVTPNATEVLNKAMKGDIPEPGTPEAELLWKARRGIK